MTISASAVSRQDVTARSISWCLVLGLTCAVLHHVRGAGAAPLRMSPPPSTSSLSSLPSPAGAITPPSSVRKPPPKSQPTPRSPPPKISPPKSPPSKLQPSKSSPPRSPPPRSPPPRSPPPRSPPPKSLPPSPLRKPPPSPQPKSPPPAPAQQPPTPSDSCSFCAKVAIVEPTDLKMVPAICTDMATQVMYDIKELYAPPSSNVRNVGNVRTSCTPDSLQVTICTSVRATALPTVSQAALDERVWGWTQVARFYIDDCKPFILISSEITSPDGCLSSDQSDAYACDNF
ncbi:hypothetical protein VaNZ11_016246 [Volvox africanus]|uniref:Pherophorin domain-containing protein n=1 Tax=Volvox africanus TaxID=51714 RepID=A0ABQ5SNE6_9CHLO|nr:hypothetical protein VaNZ11_016246 [Volvox africanus]